MAIFNLFSCQQSFMLLKIANWHLSLIYYHKHPGLEHKKYIYIFLFFFIYNIIHFCSKKITEIKNDSLLAGCIVSVRDKVKLMVSSPAICLWFELLCKMGMSLGARHGMKPRSTVLLKETVFWGWPTARGPPCLRERLRGTSLCRGYLSSNQNRII